MYQASALYMFVIFNTKNSGNKSSYLYTWTGTYMYTWTGMYLYTWTGTYLYTCDTWTSLYMITWTGTYICIHGQVLD